MGIGQANGDSFGGGEEGDANDDGRNDSTGAENSASNSGEKALADVMRTVQKQNPKMSYADVIKTALSIATGNLPSAAVSAISMVNKAIAAGAKTKSDLKAMGFSDAQISEMETAARTVSSSRGESGSSSTTGTGNEGGLYDFLASGQSIAGDATTANANPSLNDQFKNLFEGENAPFNVSDLLTQNQRSIQDADKKYADQSATLMDKWNQFESNFDDYYGSMSKQYDDLNADYDSNRSGYTDILNQQKNLYTGYQDKARSIPQLNLSLPGGMGGGSFSLAPTKWNDVYSQQAETSGNILNAQNSTLNNQLQSINSKKGAFDSKTDLLTPWASQQNTALANQGIAAQNQYNNRMKSLESLLTPFNTAYNIYDRDKQIAADVSLQDSRLDALEPNSYDKWAPIAAAALPSVINIGKDLFGGLGSSAGSSVLGGGLSW